MTKDTILSILRSVLTLVGSYAIGHAIFGIPITTSTWDVVIGSVLTLGSTVWGIIDKSASIEMIQSGLRSVFISIGGVLSAAGVVSGEVVNQILGLITALTPILQSYLSKLKVQQISNGVVVASPSGKVIATTSSSTTTTTTTTI